MEIRNLAAGLRTLTTPSGLFRLIWKNDDLGNARVTTPDGRWNRDVTVRCRDNGILAALVGNAELLLEAEAKDGNELTAKAVATAVSRWEKTFRAYGQTISNSVAAYLITCGMKADSNALSRTVFQFIRAWETSPAPTETLEAHLARCLTACGYRTRTSAPLNYTIGLFETLEERQNLKRGYQP